MTEPRFDVYFSQRQRQQREVAKNRREHRVERAWYWAMTWLAVCAIVVGAALTWRVCVWALR